ncbi:MAG: glycosyltransferase [Nitrospirae bacterium]|nr:glycosyltransferase [Nitrospirota bacterium]
MFSLHKPPKEFDLIIYHCGRKSYRDVPKFDGHRILFHHTEDTGLQSYFVDKIKVERIFFVSNWAKRHFLKGENLENKINKNGASVEDAWIEARTWDDSKFGVQYPPINKRNFDRRIRYNLNSCGQLLKKVKVGGDWFSDWFEFLTKDLSKIIPMDIKIDSIKTVQQKRDFWNGNDAVIWVSTTKESFGLNLHEAVFCGCVPIIYHKNDATQEIAGDSGAGCFFDTRDELIEIINNLKQDPSEVERHSELSLKVTEQLLYENWYKTFMEKVKDITGNV